MTFVSADEPQTRQVVRWIRCMDLVFDGLGLQLLACCAELSVNFVNGDPILVEQMVRAPKAAFESLQHKYKRGLGV